jgi:hypothetical protein
MELVYKSSNELLLSDMTHERYPIMTTSAYNIFTIFV